MSGKQKLILILALPVIILSVWIYALFSVLGNKTSTNSADINGAIKTTKTQTNSGDNTLQNTQLSGDTVSVNNGTGDQSEQKIKKITVYMPEYFDTKGFDIISKKLLKDKKIFVKFNTFKDLNEYKSTLNADIVSGNIDLFMIPNDWLESFDNNGYKFDFKSDISQLFSYLFYDYLKNKKYTFIPYSIDPFVTYVSKNISMGDKDISVDKIKEIALVSSAESSSRILFNMTSFDSTLLKLGKPVFSDYFLMLYNLIYQSYLSQDKTLLSTFLPDSNQNTLGEDPKMVMKVANVLDKRNEDCHNFVNVCLMSNGYGDISFGFLSYRDIWDKYFSTDAKKTSDDFAVYNFFSDANVYLVRGWGFMINKNSKNIDSDLEFINEYITQGVNGNNLIWNNSLSAFNNILSNQRINRDYENIFKYENKFQIMHGAVDTQEKFTQRTPILDVLKGNYSLDAFIEQLDWEF